MMLSFGYVMPRYCAPNISKDKHHHRKIVASRHEFASLVLLHKRGPKYSKASCRFGGLGTVATGGYFQIPTYHIARPTIYTVGRHNIKLLKALWKKYFSLNLTLFFRKLFW